MGRIWITLPESYIDHFELKRTEVGMTKGAFLKLLLAEHDNAVPITLKDKMIISELSDVKNILSEILISEKFDTEKKMLLDEKIKALSELFKQNQ